MNTVRASLTEGSVPRHLARLSLPMVLGIFSLIAYNLADTYFVARLGARELAAISFTFPVVMVFGGIAMGVGMGAGSCISRAIGEGNPEKTRRLATDSLTLSLALVAVFVLAGMLTINPLFRALGATGDLLPLIRSYMLVWYPGMICLVVPMVGNHALRAMGDTVTASFIMILGAVVNVVLDPIMIFGLLGFPRLEMTGAALATVGARAATLAASLAVLHYREHVIDFSLPPLRKVLASWGAICFVGLPCAGTNIVVPVTVGMVTRIAAGHGHEAVAAIGTGSRVMAFVLIPVIALCTAIIPFIGQNWGAAKHDRVRRACRDAVVFSLVWGALSVAVLAPLARPLALLFTDDPETVAKLAFFIRVSPLGLGPVGVFSVLTAALNAVNKPLSSAALTIVRMLALFFPLALVGSLAGGYAGMVVGMTAGDALSGLVVHRFSIRLFHAPVAYDHLPVTTPE
jgi:putative MATE family efflux protein